MCCDTSITFAEQTCTNQKVRSSSLTNIICCGTKSMVMYCERNSETTISCISEVGLWCCIIFCNCESFRGPHKWRLYPTVFLQTASMITLIGGPAGWAGWRAVFLNEKRELSADWRAAQKTKGLPARCTKRRSGRLRKRAERAAEKGSPPARPFRSPA